MNTEIISYIYKLCLENDEIKFKIPSIRWFVYRFELNQNEVVRTFNFFKAQNLFLTEQGSKTYVVRRPFLNMFKNDTFIMFGNKVKRKTINQKVTRFRSLYEFTFEREFWLDGKIVLLSLDKIYKRDNEKFNIENGVDFYVKNNFKGKKIVQRDLMSVDITNFKEFKKMKTNHCIMTETRIYDERRMISHSFSLVPWKYFRVSKVEMMI